ncbi:MAG: hypothetical protein JXO22_15690 [Phycisphaerae bacterium]|nr:hypothetical protein [Phycisphaerae bacterium]
MTTKRPANVVEAAQWYFAVKRVNLASSSAHHNAVFVAVVNPHALIVREPY